jgi:uncharacterized protein YqeY
MKRREFITLFGEAGRPNIVENEYHEYQILHLRRLCCWR